MDDQILVIDLGCEYNKMFFHDKSLKGSDKIVVLSPELAEIWLEKNFPKSLVVSGSGIGHRSAYRVLVKVRKMNIPILGICSGMRMIVKLFGGDIEQRAVDAQCSIAKVYFNPVLSPLFGNIGQNREYDLRASLKGFVSILPPGFKVRAIFPHLGEIASIENVTKKIWGIMFEPKDFIWENFLKFSDLSVNNQI